MSGLPSETVSGLTEPNHAGGAFPRPDLHERLDRALTKAKPDLVVACYGMNDGIYYPPDADRLQKYQEGIRTLQARVRQSGAKLWLLTPPPFDPLPIQKDTLPNGKAEYPSGHPYAGYDDRTGAVFRRGSCRSGGRDGASPTFTARSTRMSGNSAKRSPISPCPVTAYTSTRSDTA